MGRIVHLAMNVEDIDKACEFYSKVFGFTQIKVPGLRSTARFLSDGNLHIAINQSPSEKQSGRGQIDHFGIEVENVDKVAAEIQKRGCPTVSSIGKSPKFRDPGGIIVELVAVGSKPGVSPSSYSAE